MTEEFAAALGACEEILFQPAGPAGVTPWDRLFEPFDFFNGFKNFLQVRNPFVSRLFSIELRVFCILCICDCKMRAVWRCLFEPFDVLNGFNNFLQVRIAIAHFDIFHFF